MLVRSAGRRQHQRRQTSHLLAASFAQLHLPWLAPAQLRWTASQSAPQHTLAASAPRPRSSSSKVRPSEQIRQLATAADQHTAIAHGYHHHPPPGFKNSSQDRHVPWDLQRPQAISTRPYKDPIIINTTTQSAHELIHVQIGVNGTVSELLQHFHTSLQVGRMSRAGAIVQRMAAQCSPASPEIIYAHTAYLESSLNQLAAYNSETMQVQHTLRDMQRWFELEVRNKGVQPTARMIVLMMRAIVRALPEAKQEIAIRRYAGIAEALGPGVHEEVLHAEDYDDHEYTIVGRATSELYEPELSSQPELALQPKLVIHPPAKQDGITAEEEMPEVLETQQKGGGLERVKTAMKALKDQPPLPGTATAEERYAYAYERQRIMEETSVDIAVARWRQADEELRKIGIHTAMQSKPVGALMWQWYQALLPALNEELAETKKALSASQTVTDDRNVYGPYLELMSMEKLAASTIIHMIAEVSRGKSRETGNYESERKLGYLASSIGDLVESEHRAELSAQKSRRKKERQKQAKRADLRRRSGVQRPVTGVGETAEDMQWPVEIRIKLGAMLVSKVIATAQLPVTRYHARTKEKITRMQPAFMHRMRWAGGKKCGLVAPNSALLEKLESEPVGGLIAKRMPMVVEPQAWNGWEKGGYIHYALPILRLPPGDRSGRDYFMAADRNKDLDQVYSGLNALSKVPWKVHQRVLKVQIEAWNTGEAVANFAPLNPQLTVPPEPQPDAGFKARGDWMRQVREIENLRGGLHSKRCFQNFQLEIARSVKDETLYFPHNMDFRGRAYPIPPYLNHMGADNVRGMLMFAEGKPLGQDGLRWLKIHMATVAGHDKASLDERIAFTMEHLDDIYDSVRDPLGGRRWWLEAEDAWQTLAAAFELTEALDSPNPTQYISHLPIQQDGTCNGLQHYAALGGDEIGARQVNLEPGDRPADVYTAVADAVKEEIRRDAESGNPIAEKLHGRLTRKCVKQPVMTNVYGVTFYGARAQVEKQLAVLFPEVSRADEVNHGIMANYVATKIFKSLGDMFRGAQSIQTWLGQCAHRISTCMTSQQIHQALALSSGWDDVDASKPTPEEKTKKTRKKKGKASKQASSAKTALFKSTVVWTTPIGLPVVQPYRTSQSRTINTQLQALSIKDPQVWDPVSKRKQLQAFPPNFIHSLDATHMLLSAAKCTDLGLTFASIHDSFWTHACNVDAMSSVLRDAFVEMHSENIVHRLREEFKLRYKDCMYLASVDLEDAALRKQVRTVRKELGKTRENAELATEVERLRLLKSEDPEERQKGEEMVTPASIFASAGDPGHGMGSVNEMEAHGLGEMPNKTGEEATAQDVEAANTDADAVLFADDAATMADDADSESALEDEASGFDPDGDDEITAEERRNNKGREKAKPNLRNRILLWLPMEFPEVPEKGTFDVTRLRASKYFFH